MALMAPLKSVSASPLANNPSCPGVGRLFVRRCRDPGARGSGRFLFFGGPGEDQFGKAAGGENQGPGIQHPDLSVDFVPDLDPRKRLPLSEQAGDADTGKHLNPGFGLARRPWPHPVSSRKMKVNRPAPASRAFSRTFAARVSPPMNHGFAFVGNRRVPVPSGTQQIQQQKTAGQAASRPLFLRPGKDGCPIRPMPAEPPRSLHPATRQYSYRGRASGRSSLRRPSPGCRLYPIGGSLRAAGIWQWRC